MILDSTSLPRRERAKLDKHERIFRAARELFEEHGFDGVTTQQIADRADVAAGTVFRYAASKGELLLMVYNVALRNAIGVGLTEAQASGDPATAAWTAVQPLLDAAAQGRDTALYQRELVFGPAEDRYREEGLALISEFERGLAQLLARGEPDAAALAAARTVFAIVHLALIQSSLPANTAAAASDLRVQLDQVVAGYLAATHPVAGTTRRKEKTQ